MKQFVRYLRQVGSTCLYRKDSNILFQGEVPRRAIIIVDGIVKVYTLNHDGDEIIVDIYARGSVLPASWINGQSATALFSYQAASDVRTIEIAKDIFLSSLHASTEFQEEYIHELTRNQASLLLRVTGLCQSKAVEKICFTLYHLLFRHGHEKADGWYELDIKLTHHTVASLIGQTRESTAKNLKILKDAGVIDYASSMYKINRPKLESFLGEETFYSLKL